VVIGDGSLIGAGVKIIGDSHGPVRVGSRVQILENTVLHLLPDNELIIDDDAVIGPGAMIHGCHIGRGSIVEPGAIVCDGSVIGAESWSAPVPASSSATVSATGPSWTASRPHWPAP
jgi:carbonic anhydrase/acetyltransferase-like protein (isoleucine patch superfamily)